MRIELAIFRKHKTLEHTWSVLNRNHQNRTGIQKWNQMPTIRWEVVERRRLNDDRENERSRHKMIESVHFFLDIRAILTTKRREFDQMFNIFLISIRWSQREKINGCFLFWSEYYHSQGIVFLVPMILSSFTVWYTVDWRVNLIFLLEPLSSMNKWSLENVHKNNDLNWSTEIKTDHNCLVFQKTYCRWLLITMKHSTRCGR